MPMSRSSDTTAPRATREDIRRIVGDLEDAKTLEILALTPTVGEIEEAVLWAAGTGDVLSRNGRPLTRVAAAIVDILALDEDEEPR